LAAGFPADRILSPPDPAPTLPYADRSIDVVACRPAPRAVKEARRVASGLVLTTRSGGIRVVTIDRGARHTPVAALPRRVRRGGDRHVLVCSHDVPRRDRDSGGRRIVDFLDFLQDAGWTVTLLAGNGVSEQRDADALTTRGIRVCGGLSERIEDVLRERYVDLALIAFWTNGERYLRIIRQESPSTRVLVDSVDLHFLREARGEFQSGRGAAPGQLDAAFASRLMRELNVYAAADGVLTVSEKEAELVRDLTAGRTPVHTVPDCEEIPALGLPFARRRGILSLGSYSHTPNVQAVESLCREILPKVDRSLRRAHPVSVVGSGPTDAIRELCESTADVRLVGWVPSVEPYFERARISVIPLRYGAGTKRKMIQALMAGTPTVSTSIGAEGLGLRHGEHLLIADDPTTFAAAIARLLTDETLWRRLARRGRALVARHHSRGAARARLMQAIDRLLQADTKLSPQFAVAAWRVEHTAASSYHHRLVPSIRDVVRRSIPPTATVAVVSKGDAELTQLAGVRAWHFPQDADGVYAGHYPATSADAVAHLETLRARGAGFLLFPATALWWLEHYNELKAHLETHYRLVVDDPDACVIYDLSGAVGSTIQTGVADDPVSASLEAAAGVRLIAFYLPQFHPIPENDAWWGPGFTEWRNVARADPLFQGHYQPHIPADLGFYDLRLPDIREAQADLARQYGIHGFCYYHYWFGGKRLLDRPFDEVLASGRPDLPFCLCWANEPWSRRWDGREDDLLQAQTYSAADDLDHIRWLLPALGDRRAIGIDGKPIFLVYRSQHLANAARTTDIWREAAHKAGLPGLYLIAMETAWDLGRDATEMGFDAKVLFQPQFGTLISSVRRVAIGERPHLNVYTYRDAWRALDNLARVRYRRYETVFPSWDNTARVGENAMIIHECSPSAYEAQLRRAVARQQLEAPDHRVVFINAWNEWAEGCHLEPDLRHGRGYLEATRAAVAASAQPV
jgi:glycosyltransferase involved in cell wall biosynthesis